MKETEIRVARGEMGKLAKMFGRSMPYIRFVLRGQRRSAADAGRIRQAAMKMGGVEYKKV
jgi:hypothetical protein